MDHPRHRSRAELTLVARYLQSKIIGQHVCGSQAVVDHRWPTRTGSDMTTSTLASSGCGGAGIRSRNRSSALVIAACWSSASTTSSTFTATRQRVTGDPASSTDHLPLTEL